MGNGGRGRGMTTFDEREKVADGTHERYVTTREKFKERLEEKLGS